MAMRMQNIQMSTTVDKAELRKTLEANLVKHRKIVKEARAGYLDKAKELLERKLGELREGKLVAVSVTLQPPADYSEVYLNSIEMLKWNTEEKVILQADEFRQLIRDQWDWTDIFLTSNRMYSSTAARMYDARAGSGGGADDCYDAPVGSGS